MSDWKSNAIMSWAGNKVSDHGRAPLAETVERIGTDKRMADGTLRRQFIGLKRKWSTSWENLPSVNPSSGPGMRTADGGMSGSEMEEFYYDNPGPFRMTLRRGSAIDKTAPNPAAGALPYEDSDFYIANVMLTEFNKEILKRGATDLWTVTVSLEEV